MEQAGEQLLEHMRERAPFPLTSREFDIIETGIRTSDFSREGLANALYVSTSTIGGHILNLHAKFGSHTVAQILPVLFEATLAEDYGNFYINEGLRALDYPKGNFSLPTFRQIEVVASVVKHGGITRAAQNLFLSAKTVKNHLSITYDVLNLWDHPKRSALPAAYLLLRKLDLLPIGPYDWLIKFPQKTC